MENLFFILFLLCFPLFIFSMIKPKKALVFGSNKKRMMIIIQYALLITIFLFLFGHFAQIDSVKTSSDSIQTIANSVLGDGYYRKHVDAESTQHVTLWLTLKNNLTKNMIKKIAWQNSKEIFEEIFKTRKDVKTIALMWYPEDSKIKAMSLEISRDTFKSLNWDNVKYLDIPRVVNDYQEGIQFN